MGRDPHADVQLGDPCVSRQHAHLERVPNGFLVQDRGSRYGTFVNGEAIAGRGVVAAFGSVLRVGGVLLLVVADVPLYGGPHRIGASFLGTRRDALAGPTLWAVWQQATRAASLSQPVLILGESGSGKEGVARLIHAARTVPGPFVPVNLAAVPEGLFESELFGHTRGAFTGAHAPRLGAFREAHDGVLFLDEVADVRLDLQAKLLRAIDQMRVRPLGAASDEPINARVVAATSRDLVARCAAGTFRTDLFYRLSGIVLNVPPLRERRDEILFLAEGMLRDAGASVALSVAAAEALTLADWPGNVRQLENALTQATVAALERGATVIQPEQLPVSIREASRGPVTRTPGVDAILQAFKGASGNATRAAEALGVSRAQLYKLLKRHGLEPSTLRAEP